MTWLFPTIQEWEWLVALSARVVVGGMFTLSGSGKLFDPARRHRMLETVRKAGLAVPSASVDRLLLFSSPPALRSELARTSPLVSQHALPLSPRTPDSIT